MMFQRAKSFMEWEPDIASLLAEMPVHVLPLENSTRMVSKLPSTIYRCLSCNQLKGGANSIKARINIPLLEF